MPELGFFSREGACATLDLSYTECSAACVHMGIDLDDDLHGLRVLHPHTREIIALLSRTETKAEADCERIVAFLREKYVAAEANNDTEAVWSVLGLEG